MIQFYYKSPNIEILPSYKDKDITRHLLYSFASYLRGDFTYEKFSDELKDINNDKRFPSLFEFIFNISGNVYRYGFTCNHRRIYEEWLYCNESKMFNRQVDDLSIKLRRDVKDYLIDSMSKLYKEVSKPY